MNATEEQPGLDRARELHRAGRLVEAEAAYRKAAASRPERPDAWYFLGIFLFRTGRADEALRCLERAASLAPEETEYAANLAVVLRDRGRDGDALDWLRRAVAADPAHAKARFDLGNLLADIGRTDEAIRVFEDLLARHPDHRDGRLNLGLLHLNGGNPHAARACFERLLEGRPDDDRAAKALAEAFLEEGDAGRAAALLRRATARDPADPAAWYNLGNALNRLNRLDEAETAHGTALRLAPGDREARAQLFHLRQRLCDWAGTTDLEPALDADTAAALAEGTRPGETPFMSIARRPDTRINRAVSAAWSRDIAARMAPFRRRLPPIPARPVEKRHVTLGYLSTNFHDHPTAYNTARLMALHDRAAFRVVAFSCGPDDGSPIRRRIKESCDAFVDIRDLDHLDAARRVRKEGVDVLIGLLGHTDGSRLEIAALRPAPIQVAYLTFPGPPGGAGIFDYVLADRIVLPEEDIPLFDEAVAWMPHCYWPTDDQAETPPPPPPRQTLGLPGEARVFCSFNQAYKIEPVMFSAWMRILAAVPDGVLWLLGGHPIAEANLRNAARSAGIDPARLLFAPRVPKAEHLARLGAADLVLDTRIYTGHTTTLDALRAGVPVVAMAGSHFASRVSASILAAAGLGDLVARDIDGFVALAVDLASRPGTLEAARERLRSAGPTRPLFDTPRFVADLDLLLRQMWDRHAAGLPPARLP
jgi:protein O-GlcNAc transferase